MLSRFARANRVASFPRACLRFGVASLLLIGGLSSVHDASATGDTRTLSFHHTHSGEDITVTFKRNGRYDEAALKELNHYLRDWRTQDQTTMDRHLFDVLWEVYRDVDAKQPIQIISSYRSPATNAMLRRRSSHSGVARSSQHMLGHAMDFYIPGVPLEQIRFAGLRLQRGGVGFYPTSGSPFVHLDTGNVRHWPRMTREQLVRVFPNGRTVHVPSDGNPLPGYELALADLQRRKADDGSGSGRNFLASLFRGKATAPDDDEEGAPSAADGKAAPSALVASINAGKTAAAKIDTAKIDAAKTDTGKIEAANTEAVPLPRAKPASYRVASATSQPVVLAAAAAPATPAAEPIKAAAAPKPQTPADIINSRGFWGDEPAKAKQASPEQIAALAARNAFASMDPAADKDQVLAYAPGRVLDRSRIVTASAPMPRLHAPLPARHAGAEITTIVTKGQQGRSATITTASRIAPANMNTAWMRAMIMTPSISTGMLAVSFGDQDMTTMRHLFIKPTSTVATTFSGESQSVLSCERFSGSAMTPVAITAFTLASLR
ncbi:DUF882 domain-containing protein [Bradyrhizobium sp. WD16]|uniref:DUF882 domain-containing protein n=1 Tax=Bradyrhizobium sp. WD16 TaxID=1521768 RepID=UPI0020A36C78|nr:DUF882 domain-containing protein [Bradyrhizobium sp. WD16]UTD26318.1 ATP-binding protein [Bradyrhizobium sp. WD16]